MTFNNNFQPDPIIGTPFADQYFMDGPQSHVNMSDIKCQEYIIQMFTGVDVPTSQLASDALDFGLSAPDSELAIDDMGNLLELYGVPVNKFEQSNIYHLVNELAQGHKVMIPVDSGELRNGSGLLESIWEALGLDSGADHAVIVSGIDTSDPSDPAVIVSDPETGETAAKYPLDQFLAAWEDSNFSMVSTQLPAPHSVPGMEFFPYDMGHIPMVLDMPYEQFAQWDPCAWQQHDLINMQIDSDVLDPAFYADVDADTDLNAWRAANGLSSAGSVFHGGSAGEFNGAFSSIHDYDSGLDGNDAFDDYNEWMSDYYTQMGSTAMDNANYALQCGDIDSFEYYSGLAESDFGDADFYGSYTVDNYHSAADEVVYESYEDYMLESYDDVPY